jgi:hypothetical protein
LELEREDRDKLTKRLTKITGTDQTQASLKAQLLEINTKLEVALKTLNEKMKELDSLKNEVQNRRESEKLEILSVKKRLEEEYF